MGKVVTLDELLVHLSQSRGRRRSVSFANGHFDLLHVGHIRYLREASEKADVLIVGINGDSSVARLKGKGRPIVPACERAELIAALEMVDFVLVFEEDSPEGLLRRIQPDVHCKGWDYETPEDVPEYSTVQSYGGTTALVGDPKDHSTRDLITRIKAL